MVFQGFSFFAMAIISVGVIAYHFYKNREAYLQDATQTYNIYNSLSELSYNPSSEEDLGLRRRKAIKGDTCSICMESVQNSSLENTALPVTLPCEHVFHNKCVKTWLNMNKTCPNCRAPAIM